MKNTSAEATAIIREEVRKMIQLADLAVTEYQKPASPPVEPKKWSQHWLSRKKP